MKLDEKTNIAIISHFTIKEKGQSEVFPGNIRNFLVKKGVKVTYIDHPFIRSQGASSDFIASQMRIYENKKESDRLTAPGIKLPTVILFIYQAVLTVFFMLKEGRKYDACIACDNLSLIPAVLLRKLGLIKKLIYYTVDYSPNRYKNPFLNSLYHYMDRFASKVSDINWIAVENMLTAKAQNGLNIKKSAPFVVVPIGFSKAGIEIKPIEKVNRFNLVFVGYIFEKQGLQLVIEVLPKLIKTYPKTHLTIIGSGPYDDQIRKLVSKNHLRSHVTFTGYIKNHQEITRLLKDGGIGLAPYIPSMGDYTYNADPSKIKLYLACGLPVITSSVPPIAKDIAKKKAGFAINYTQQDLIDSLNYLLKSNKDYEKFRRNALKMSESYDINLILDTAFKKLS